MASETQFDPDHETQQARAMRDARRHVVAPGGRLDKIVGVLARVLPMAIGALVAVMIITPLSPRGEVSFLLDRNKVGVIGERARVDNALYRGEDAKGRPFSIMAGEALQKSSRNKLVELSDMDARMILDEGPAHLQSKGAEYHFSGAEYVRMFDMNSVIALDDGPARLSGDEAEYYLEQRVLRVPGPLRVSASGGYKMVASGVSVDIDKQRLVGRSGVSGQLPAGSFSAREISVDLPSRVTILNGNAKMRIIPGRLNEL